MSLGFERFVNDAIASKIRAGFETPLGFFNLDPLHARIARNFGREVLGMTFVIYLRGVLMEDS
jgi:hypothetical protein